MKKLSLILLLIGFFIKGHSQDLIGKWYMMNRSGLIECEITEDSILTRQLFLDFKPKPKPGKAQAYFKTQNLGDRVLLITKAMKDTALFSAFVATNVENRKSFYLAWNVLDTATTTIDALISIHQQDKRELSGFLFFHEDFIASLQKLRPIDAMTLQDFKKFAQNYVDRIKNTQEAFAQYNTGYIVITYNFQTMIQALFEIGYNPLQSMATLETPFVKFSTDPEVEMIWKEVQEN
ncbi:MAG: hypothetical protein AAF206_20320 [Bacteroidota bacterium]